jgi:hypothetical protein
MEETKECTCSDNYADEKCPEHGRNGRLGVDWSTNYDPVPSMDPTGYGG